MCSGLAVAALAPVVEDHPWTRRPSSTVRPPAFVDAATVVPGLVVDMRYFGTGNFVGSRVDGYEAPVCVLTQQAATALAAVQRDLRPAVSG